MTGESKGLFDIASNIFYDPTETKYMLNLLNKLEALEEKWERMEEIVAN